MGLFKRKNKKYSTETMDNGAMLITVADPKNPVAEQFRTIRTNIHFMSVDKPLRRVALTSSNVSVGQWTVTANLAHNRGQRRHHLGPRRQAGPLDRR